MPSTPKRESPESLAPLVRSLIASELVRADDWVDWATRELMASETATPWLAELCTTYAINDAIALLAPLAGRVNEVVYPN